MTLRPGQGGRLTSVTVEASWPMGHRLMDHDGKCRGLHGHTYRLEATFEGELHADGPARGMVADFSLLKAAVKRIADHLDHAMVLEQEDDARLAIGGHARLILVPFAPTAENLAAWCLGELRPFRCVRVVLWESTTTRAEVTA